MSVSDSCSSGSIDPFKVLVEAIDDAISVYATEMVDATQDLTGLALWLSKARTMIRKREKTVVADSSSVNPDQTSTQTQLEPNGADGAAQNVDHNIDTNSNSNQSGDFVMEELDNPYSSVFDDDFVDENGAAGDMDVPNNVPAVSQSAQESEGEEELVENDEEWDKNRLNLQRALIKHGSIVELEDYLGDIYKGSVEPSDEKRRLFDLVQWSNKQRRRKTYGYLDPYQISKLDDLCEKQLWSWERAPEKTQEVPRKAIFADGVGTISRVLENASSYSPIPSRSTQARSPQLQEAAAIKKAAQEARKVSQATKRAAMKAVKEARAQSKMRGKKAVNKEWDQYFNLVKKHMPLNAKGHIWDMPLDYVAVSQGKTIQLGIWLHVQKQEMARYEHESPNWYNKLASLFEQGWSMETLEDLDALTTSFGSGSGDDEESIPVPKRASSPSSSAAAGPVSSQKPRLSESVISETVSDSSARLSYITAKDEDRSHHQKLTWEARPGLTEEQLSRHSSSPSEAGHKRKAHSPVAERVQKAPRRDSTLSSHSIKTEPGITSAASRFQAIDLCESSDVSSVHSSSSSGSSSSTYSSSTSSSVKSADSQESSAANSYSLKDKKLFNKSGSAFTSMSSANASLRPPLATYGSNKQGGAVLPPRVPDIPIKAMQSSSNNSNPPPPLSAPVPSVPAKPARSVSPKTDKAHYPNGTIKESRDPRLKRPDTHNAHTTPVPAPAPRTAVTTSSSSTSNGSAAEAPRVGSPSGRPSAQKKVPTHSLVPSDSNSNVRAGKASSRSPSQSPAATPAPPLEAPLPLKPATPVVSPLVDGKLRAEGNYVAVVYSHSSSLDDARFAIAKQLNEAQPGSNEIQVMRLLPENPHDLFNTRYKYTYNKAKLVSTTPEYFLLEGLRFLVGKHLRSSNVIVSSFAFINDISSSC